MIKRRKKFGNKLEKKTKSCFTIDSAISFSRKVQLWKKKKHVAIIQFVLVKGNLQNVVSSGEQRLPQLSVSALLHVCGSAGSFDRTFAVISAGPFEAFDSMLRIRSTSSSICRALVPFLDTLLLRYKFLQNPSLPCSPQFSPESVHFVRSALLENYKFLSAVSLVKVLFDQMNYAELAADLDLAALRDTVPNLLWIFFELT